MAGDLDVLGQALLRSSSVVNFFWSSDTKNCLPIACNDFKTINRSCSFVPTWPAYIKCYILQHESPYIIAKPICFEVPLYGVSKRVSPKYKCQLFRSESRVLRPPWRTTSFSNFSMPRSWTVLIKVIEVTRKRPLTLCTLSNCARTFIAIVGVSSPVVTISSRASVSVMPNVDLR